MAWLQVEVDGMLDLDTDPEQAASAPLTAMGAQTSPLRLVPPTPVATRGGPQPAVATPGPSLWTSDASLVRSPRAPLPSFLLSYYQCQATSYI